MKISNEIHSPHGKALGDCWSVINYFIKSGMEKDEIIRLSNWYKKGTARKKSVKQAEILPLLENDEFVQLTEEEPTVDMLPWTAGFYYISVPTKIKWKPNSNKMMCYQFDAKTNKRSRFPSKEIEDKVLNHIAEQGYKIIQLGKQFSLKKCVEIVSECEFFIGVDSGMAYLSASVGIPIFFCQNNSFPEPWKTTNHSNKHFVLSNDYIDLIDKINSYIKGGLDYYLSNAKNIHIFKNQGT